MHYICSISSDYSTQAEVLKESSSTRVKLSVVVDAPEIILPLSTTSQCAVVADLGKVEIKNQLCWAEQVYSGTECKEAELSNVVVDVMSLDVSTVQLYRSVSMSDGVCDMFAFYPG